MQLECERRIARLHSPLKDFALDEQIVEHRRDPVTGRRTIVLKGRREYVRRYFQTDDPLLLQSVERTREACPFCPGRAEKSTPRFPEDLVPRGTIRVGEARTFPSLFAHAEFNAVTVIVRSHYLRPAELTRTLLADALEASTQYLRLVREKNPQAKYGAVMMNCLPPAGSTVIHPHMQALASDQAFNMLAEVNLKTEDNWERNGANCWKDLIAEEKTRNERYLAQLGSTHWITSYAPAGFDEVLGIASNASDLTAAPREVLSSLADGLSRVLKYYDEIGVRSFNAILFSSPFGERSPYGATILRVASRYGVQSGNVNDVWGLRYFLDETEVFDSPEDTAVGLHKYFT